LIQGTNTLKGGFCEESGLLSIFLLADIVILIWQKGRDEDMGRWLEKADLLFWSLGRQDSFPPKGVENLSPQDLAFADFLGK